MFSEALLPVIAQPQSNKQRLFGRYFMAILIDLVVLNLFVEYSEWVTIDSFTTSLLAAVVLQVLLKLTLAIEHKVANFFAGKSGGLMTFFRFFSAWLVLFGSKFVILEALTMAFGENVRFDGPFHGIAILIAIIVSMLVVEEGVARLYRKLGDEPST
ncbi:hypothetical protein QTH87_25420 [Variovorax sp. J22P168]|uniref:hypothetical protein n=1 Tax=Variovorax jilinensis TaxID=3053513 RepID=UPI002576EFE8|nr:hypothetical protein [Variovorax sp. J22P168]MDM0015804.1 hypothetical protein [Variovorax sp. J22P168]